ncbi:hypothetical protein RSAG8_10855, partial [Rhizoctonia solani AG-8 WAC10335]
MRRSFLTILCGAEGSISMDLQSLRSANRWGSAHTLEPGENRPMRARR